MSYAPKKCKECGKEFIPDSPRQEYCKDVHYRPCPVCGKPVKAIYLNESPRCCSKECRTIKAKESGEERVCEICGKSFKVYGTQKYCPEPHYRPCPVCGKPVQYHRKSDPAQCCSAKCKAQLRKNTIANTIKHCAICGKEFTSTSTSAIYCSDKHYRPCPVCGKPVEFHSLSDPIRCCSIQCKLKQTKQTCINRYGVPHPAMADDARQHLRCKLQSPDVVDKIRHTNLLKYGYTNPAQSPEIRKKIRTTLLSREYKLKYESAMMSKYGVCYPMQSDELKQRQFDTCKERYDVPYACMLDQCRQNNHFIVSNRNKDVSEIFKQYGITTTLEYKIGKYAFDLYITDTKTFLEVDPTYTHNTIGNHWNHSGIDKYYHLNKSKIAIDNGYCCIHIFDWDNVDKIAMRFQHKQVVYARNCSIEVIDKATANELINNYHLQGSCNGQKICLGLYYNDVLVQVMTFGKPRYNKHYQYELLRLCTVSNILVVGGAERLFKYFIRSYNPESVISYCDLAKFSGTVYERLGFIHSHNTEPNLVWSKGVEKITNNLLLQRGYDQLFSANYGKGTSNEELMLQSGWLPVYDCGQGVYIWNK